MKKEQSSARNIPKDLGPTFSLYDSPEYSRIGCERRLLLISCSSKKQTLNDRMAIEVYDGPFYQVVRKHNRDDLDILILSAKYGLIDQNQVISTYDAIMTPKIANEIRKDSTEKLLKIINENNYSEIFVELGKTYENAIDFTKLEFMDLNIKFDSGTIGKRLHNLKEWLKSVNHQSSKTIGENNIS